MSRKSSPLIPEYVSPRYVTRSPANLEYSTSRNLIFVEDLDLTNLNKSPSSERTATTEETSFGDFIYDEHDKLFGEQIPVASETYLVDDLYILVKVPKNPKNHIPTCNTSSQTTPICSKSPQHLIYSIQEEDEEHAVEATRSKIPVKKSKKICWANDSEPFEEFTSTTNIIPLTEVASLPNEVLAKSDEPLFEVNSNALELETSLPCQKLIDIQEVDLNPSCINGRANVSLENYGILITPTKATRTDKLLVFQVDTESKNKTTPRESFCFGWIFKFFRRKRRKSGFVHAKVYKTYFVKWKKNSEGDETSKCQCEVNRNSRRNSAKF